MSVFGVEVKENQICVIGGRVSKHDALEKLIDVVAQSPAITDAAVFRRSVHEREAVTSTGIGGGIAIPHVRIPEVKAPTLGVGIVPKGVDFDAIDNNPVHIMVLFATPKGADKEYLGLLAKVMQALRDANLYKRLIACQNPNEVYSILKG